MAKKSDKKAKKEDKTGKPKAGEASKNNDAAAKKKKLDKKADIALLVAFIVVASIVFAFYMQYKKNRFAGPGNNVPRQPGQPAALHNQGANTQPHNQAAPPKIHNQGEKPGAPPSQPAMKRLQDPPKATPGKATPGPDNGKLFHKAVVGEEKVHRKVTVPAKPGKGPNSKNHQYVAGSGPGPNAPLIPGKGPVPPPEPPTTDGNNNFSYGEGIKQQELDNMLRAGEFNKAEAKLKELIKKDKNNFFATMQLGLLYKKKGNLDKGRYFLQTAHKLNPRDIYNTQQLAELYILTNPEDAIDLLEKNLTRQTDRKDLNVTAAKAYYLYVAEKPNISKADKRKRLKRSLEILEDLNQSNKGQIPASLVDLLIGHNYYLQGDYGKARNYYRNIPMSDKFQGNIMEKIEAATSMGILSLKEGEEDKAKDYLLNAYAFFAQWNDKTVEKTYPRREQLALVNYTLFGMTDFSKSLKEYNKEFNELKKNGVTPIKGSEEFISLMLEMENERTALNYNKAVKTGEKLLKGAQSQRGPYYDTVLLKPLFIGCLRLYIGDLYARKGDNRKAKNMYTEAYENFPPLKSYGLGRIKKL